MDLTIEQKALSDENKIVNLRIEHVPGNTGSSTLMNL